MDLASKKLPLALIGILLVVLAVQTVSNSSVEKFIDPSTCEIWIKSPEPAGRQYLGEFDSKCLDLKNLSRP